MTKSGSGISVVTSSPPDTIVPALLYSQTILSLLCVMGNVSQFKTLIPKQLWLNSICLIIIPVTFSSDGRLIAAAACDTAYVWDITTPNPHLVKTLVGHTKNSISLVFSSPSFISTSRNHSIKFWKIGILSIGLGYHQSTVHFISSPIGQSTSKG